MLPFGHGYLMKSERWYYHSGGKWKCDVLHSCTRDLYQCYKEVIGTLYNNDGYLAIWDNIKMICQLVLKPTDGIKIKNDLIW